MYDLIIIGGGPAGLTAGIYAVRFGLDTLVLERSEISGQITLTDIVENYPGFPEISGLELMEKYKAHALKAGVETRITEVLSVRSEGAKKVVSTDGGGLEAKAVILATGANPKHLGVPGEEALIGKGVSYCATCDGPFFRNKTVVVVGGGDSALTDALILSRIAKQVYLVHRRDRLKAAKVLQERAFSAPNIEFIYNTAVREIVGSTGEIRRVEKVILENLKSGEVRELPTNGIFIYIGIRPNTEIVDVDKDERGFIRTGRWMESSEKGIYAIGDCRDTPIWQLVTAVSDGAVAATAVNEYLESLKYPEKSG
ncbi:thioredoxin-disulfide reductase [Methanosarcina sp. KYL-1]|uniref:thioredoxin-disulfide reductase n=1 Tax=Methanosarcina sp. KYL-1 TaxID=2602068 RepID=UPI0021015E89|nr:thioredoxin-disulfide reductase [Methanosarcina sp. KYL-1]MCQ1535839.1 thioredoxin-disulfide reductase [Methanosarcina sp. KYL-1]